MSRNKQASLFASSPDTALVLSEQFASAGKPANKQQAKLQRLVRQIEAQRAVLREWSEFHSAFQFRINAEMLPLQEQYQKCNYELLLAIDSALKTRGWITGKLQRRRAADLIVGISATLLGQYADSEYSPALEKLHDEYSNLSYAEGQEMNREMEKKLMAAIFGGEPDDYSDEIDGIDEGDAPMPDFSAGPASDPDIDFSERPRTKRERETAKLVEEASQSVRQVFRKLASTLHPDRESDPLERERKTAMMQRVNEAYARNDLLGLLSLQFEIEQIDTEHLATLDEQKTRQYVYLFSEQLKEIKQEIIDIVSPYRQVTGNYKPSFRPKTVEKSFADQLATFRRDIQNLERLLVSSRDKATIMSCLTELA